MEASTFAAFVAVGLGTGWTMVDASYANMAQLMSKLPEGLMLPSHADIIGKICSSLTIGVCWACIYMAFAPDFTTFRRMIWTLYAVAFTSALLMASLWFVTIGGIGVFVILPVAIGTIVGTLSSAVVYPMAPIFFDEAVVAAVLTGNGVGATVAGLLGLLQASSRSFGTTYFMLCIAGLTAVAIFSWRHILQHRLAFKDDADGDASSDSTKGTAAAAAAAATTAVARTAAAGRGGGGGGENGVASPPSAGSAEQGLAVKQPHESTALLKQPLKQPEEEEEESMWMLVKMTAPFWALAIPTQAATWGVVFPALQFATAHTGCDCSPGAALPKATYSIASSCAYILMPCGALLAYFVPIRSLRFLAALDVLQMAMLTIVVCAMTGVSFMRCSEAARIALIICVGAMRLIDQYISTLLYQLAARRFEGKSAKLRKLSAFLFGQAMGLPTLVVSLLMFLLVQSGTIKCNL